MIMIMSKREHTTISTTLGADQILLAVVTSRLNKPYQQTLPLSSDMDNTGKPKDGDPPS